MAKQQTERKMSQAEAAVLILDLTPGSLWTHDSGSEYEIMFLANLQYSVKYPLHVVYKNAGTGTAEPRIWTRRADDWHRSMARKLLPTTET